jgi:hypothetical protein
MRFSPFNFQAPLAAGGVTLMAFNWLQFAVPHGPGPVKLADIHWSETAVVQSGLYGLLVGIMLALALANVLLTLVFLRDMARWLRTPGPKEFMSGPPSRITGIFVPIASLAMTVAVLFAVLPFFIPGLTANTPALLIPGLIVFGSLLLAVLGLEPRVLRSWLGRPLDAGGFNFVWLLDVFAIGLVSLSGTGIASAASNRGIASSAALASVLVLVTGSILLAVKAVLLIRAQLRSRRSAENQLRPAFFLLVPVTCLYGISYYRLMLHMQKWFGSDIKAASQILITASYVVAMGWAVFAVYLLRDYFRTYFRTSDYFPTQWAMV